MVVSSASQASSTGAKGGFLYTRFNPRGQKGLICTRDNFTMARRGQNGWICTRESVVVSERGGFVHVGWSPLIIVEFYVVITDTIAGFAASHRPYATSAARQPRRNSLRFAPFGPPTVSCVLAAARTCIRQAPPTSRGRGPATSAAAA